MGGEAHAMDIRKAAMCDVERVTALAHLLWPDSAPSKLSVLFHELLSSDEAAVFLCLVADEPVGFAQCQLRHDYVEGTDSSPVGYLEGVYVLEQYRRRSVARSLLAACEAWAAGRGCTEFASDCELHNTDSLRFHLGCGFHEANRIICLTKKLRGGEGHA